jgi:uncharacterized membrane protein
MIHLQFCSSATITINAPKDEVWAVLADFDEIYEVITEWNNGEGFTFPSRLWGTQ